MFTRIPPVLGPRPWGVSSACLGFKLGADINLNPRKFPGARGPTTPASWPHSSFNVLKLSASKRENIHFRVDWVRMGFPEFGISYEMSKPFADAKT